MKMNESICKKVVDSLRYGMKIDIHQEKGFYQFARTLNAINALDGDGHSAINIQAGDGQFYRMEDYYIAEPFQSLILPGKVSVLSDYNALEARDVPYYKDDQLVEYDILTPSAFKNFQSGLFYKARREVVNFVCAKEIKIKELRVEEIAHRIAVHKGFSSVLGIICECMGLITSGIVAEPPVGPTFPIVMNVYYKHDRVYSYDAEDVVTNYFGDILIRNLTASH